MVLAATLETRTELSLLREVHGGAGPCPSHTARKWQSHNRNPAAQQCPHGKAARGPQTEQRVLSGVGVRAVGHKELCYCPLCEGRATDRAVVIAVVTLTLGGGQTPQLETNPSPATTSWGRRALVLSLPSLQHLPGQSAETWMQRQGQDQRYGGKATRCRDIAGGGELGLGRGQADWPPRPRPGSQQPQCPPPSCISLPTHSGSFKEMEGGAFFPNCFSNLKIKEQQRYL